MFRTLCLASLAALMIGNSLNALLHPPIPKRDVFKNKCFLQGKSHDLFIIHGIPKCGTHFIRKTILFMTDRTFSPGIIFVAHLEDAFYNDKILMTTQPYAEKAAEILQENHHRVISLIRDPRDALVSQAFYMRSFPGQSKRDFFVIGPHYDDLTLDEQIFSLIYGSEHSPSYVDYYMERVGWALNPNHHVVKYEDLVGSDGGGEDERKLACLKGIADFIHLDATQEELEKVANKIYTNFGEVSHDHRSYKKASAGNWKEFLNEEHKAALKKKWGNLLIDLGYEETNDW